MLCFARFVRISLLGSIGLVGAAGCGSSEDAATPRHHHAGASSSSAGGSAGAGGQDVGGAGGAGGAPDPGACQTPPPSACGTESSWVRGIAHFDPAHFSAGAQPVLRLALRHPFTFFAGEEAIGGRLHANANVPLKDVASGQQEFAIDMCTYGAAMWSEENGAFHLVGIIDDNGNNDIDQAVTNQDAIEKGTPDSGELVKMVDVFVSCHAAPACLDVTLDCADGTACTTIVPVTSCEKKTPGCTSADAFCH